MHLMHSSYSKHMQKIRLERRSKPLDVIKEVNIYQMSSLTLLMSLGLRDSILSEIDLSRIEWQSVQTGQWMRG
jgi:hypothetical protein